MTTRDELVEGFRMIVREGLRVTSTFGPSDWQRQVHGEGGWDRKKIYCHLTAVAEITPGLVGNLANQSKGQDAAAGLDIDAFNAQLVAAKEQLSEQELMAAFRTAYEKLIEFIKTVPEEQLVRKVKFGAVEGPVIDVVDSVLVLHGLAHIYSAGASATG